MAHIFYAICEAITENITGITNGELSIWEFAEYVTVLDKVTVCVNIATVIGIIIGIVGVTTIARFCYKNLKRIFV